MRMSLFFLLVRMDQAQEAVEETAESINPMDLDPLVFGPFDPLVLLKISQDMARVLD